VEKTVFLSATKENQILSAFAIGLVKTKSEYKPSLYQVIGTVFYFFASQKNKIAPSALVE